MSERKEHYKINLPPDTFVLVPHADLRAFVGEAVQRAGLDSERSDLLAGLLVGNDLRGVFSHGTRQAARYARAMRDGRLNPSPDVHVIRETPASVVVDGDGGLGYFPMMEGTRRAIEKARSNGIAVMQTRNHGHIGAAGIYSRMTLEHDLLTFVTGGNQKDLEPGQPVYSPAVGSPMSFSAPAGSEDPLVVDFSPVYDLRSSPHREQIARWIPGTVFRCIGLGAIAQAWGGVLAGTTFSSSGAVRRYAEAGQTALLVTFQIGLFIDPAEFRREMEEFARRVATLEPLEGFERSQLAGGPEGERERQYRVEGIPVGPFHQADLEELAADAGLDVPWKV
jgi:LDH2 family malate/lactate/ureidoglycolate dehydrogenase